MVDQTDDPDLDAAFEADVPELYFNSFANYLSGSDILSVLQRNGRPVVMINMSLPVAKAYATFILTMVASHEAAAGYELNPNVDASGDDGGGPSE